jgi:hypothetical protein
MVNQARALRCVCTDIFMYTFVLVCVCRTQRQLVGGGIVLVRPCGRPTLQEVHEPCILSAVMVVFLPCILLLARVHQPF